MSFVNVYRFVCVRLSLLFEGGMSGLIIFVPDHCFSFYFAVWESMLFRSIHGNAVRLSFYICES